MDTVTYRTLEHVAGQARPYPAHLLEGCESGLVLFSAAFLGHNDAIHFAEAGLVTTCIDTDADRLHEMRELYPEQWAFVNTDAYAYAEAARHEELTWDAVSVDTFTGPMTRRSLDSLELWCSLAERLVTATVTNRDSLHGAEGLGVPPAPALGQGLLAGDASVNPGAPFLRGDLEELHSELFSRADRVVPMRDVFMGDTGERVIGLRHDVDDNHGSFDTALAMAQWEFEHGYSSTYFLLHDSHYWDERVGDAPEFEELGHEVGIHVNALAEGLRQKRAPEPILRQALCELRSTGVRVVGCVAHGDSLCHTARFVNDEMFVESPRPDRGAPDRRLEHRGAVLPLAPISRRNFELEYDANWLPREHYLSDSGGKWSTAASASCARASAPGSCTSSCIPTGGARPSSRRGCA